MHENIAQTQFSNGNFWLSSVRLNKFKRNSKYEKPGVKYYL